MHCDTTKYVWDKLKNIYEGYDKVKKEKLKTDRGQFETLKMKEEENITYYSLRIYEVVITIRILGKKVDKIVIEQIVIRSLPLRFDPNIFAIEEMKDLENMTMDELHGILIA